MKVLHINTVPSWIRGDYKILRSTFLASDLLPGLEADTLYSILRSHNFGVDPRRKGEGMDVISQSNSKFLRKHRVMGGDSDDFPRFNLLVTVLYNQL